MKNYNTLLKSIFVEKTEIDKNTTSKFGVDAKTYCILILSGLKVSGMIAGCFGKDWKDIADKYHLEVEEQFDDEWIASLKSKEDSWLSFQLVLELIDLYKENPDKQEAPYYFAIDAQFTVDNKKSFIVFTDDKLLYEITTKEKCEEVKKIAREKGLKEEHLDFYPLEK